VPRDWDAAAYERLPIPMTRWGEAGVGRLELEGSERVIDAGWGTGQVTASGRRPRAVPASRASAGCSTAWRTRTVTGSCGRSPSA
jgi:hypothetical protein